MKRYHVGFIYPSEERIKEIIDEAMVPYLTTEWCDRHRDEVKKEILQKISDEMVTLCEEIKDG